ncbi:MAG: complex I NDUFA9 subunit family protein [Gammaproteobacteria bacterium]|nr:complex I NDUFA9 subunit family protein [Gammaproteobacteria bacterium]
MQHHHIILFGGSGFIGNQLAIALANRNCNVTLPCRRPHRQQALRVHPNIRIIEADVFDDDQLNALCRGQHAAINLIGILHQRQDDDFRRVHVDFVKSLVATCSRNGISRLLHLSALGADQASGSSQYLRSKGEGENLLHTFGQKDMQVTSFQPSVVFGKGDQFINRFASILKLTPLLFPLACPDSQLAPVYLNDLVGRIVDSVDDPSTYSRRISICGPEVFTLRQIIEMIIETTSSPCRVVPLGDGLSRLQAMILGALPGKLFTLDNYRSLQTPNICNQGDLCKTSLPRYLLDWNNHSGFRKYYDQFRRYQASYPD